VEFDPAAVDWIARRGHQPEYGARPLRRTIQREVDNHLSRLLLDGRLPEGSRVRVTAGDGRLAFHTEEPGGGAEPPEQPGRPGSLGKPGAMDRPPGSRVADPAPSPGDADGPAPAV
jgi:ATP-dependent Clp protease ATP-binding subunit ClpC